MGGGGGGGQFFSPAANDPITAAPYYAPQPNPSPYGQMGGQQQQPAYGVPPGQAAYGQMGGQQAGLANQFGNLSVGHKPPPVMVTTTNLVGLPLNPAELFGAGPPEIRLPLNVSPSLLSRTGSRRTKLIRRDDTGLLLTERRPELRSLVPTFDTQRNPDVQHPPQQVEAPPRLDRDTIPLDPTGGRTRPRRLRHRHRAVSSLQDLHQPLRHVH